MPQVMLGSKQLDKEALLQQVAEHQGVLLFDKPTGWTSHDVVAFVRGITRIKKVGHSGTLDPLATGLLVVLVGREATKQQDRFLKQHKTYLVTACLGAISDTYDAEGEISPQATYQLVREKASQEQIQAWCQKHLGEISQTVPPYSAVKVAGRRLHHLARSGELPVEAELPKRTVTIFELVLRSYHDDEKAGSVLVELEVACSSGTYIRSLVHQLGQDLTIGAYVTELRRTKIGDLTVKSSDLLHIE